MEPKGADMQRGRNRDINILGDQRDKDLSPEMRRRDKIQLARHHFETPPRVVISEISTAADSRGRIRVMKTQMRSRWEIFEGRRDKGGRGLAEPEKDRRKDRVTKNRRDTRARRSSHSWHAECNVTRRCPYLFAIISARFHRSGYGRRTYGIARRDGCTTIQVGIRPVILRRRCENRSCVTTSTGFSNGDRVARLSVSPLSLFRVSRVFRDFALTRPGRAQARISARIYDECEKNLLSRRPFSPDRRCPSRGPREHVREDARRFRERHEPTATCRGRSSATRGKNLFAIPATLLPLNDGLPMVLRLFFEMKRIDYPCSMSSGLSYQPTHLPHLVPFFVR
ncbi:hypothetical protein DBV15_07590 [Temnothorax longispinosus]|uniref:Uncharacterized protein n=1 Tax=Temnothorax longispinosus TaxID=300112 RepID=A0A4V3SCS9_9HYME|nr:hypothetical protein DBV15_07590 [Temnothorax longispinosus]